MSTLHHIKKRDGTIVAFDQEKITKAIWKAAQSVGGTNQVLAQKISNQVMSVLEVFFKNGENVPTVEQIQDLVEKILIEDGHAKTAKAYILYRQKQTDLREQKEQVLGRTATTKFSLTALKLLKQHFLLRAEDGSTIETPEEMMKRVASSIAAADKQYQDFDPKETEQTFYEMLVKLDFLPAGTVFANAGTSHQQLLNHFELHVEDSMESIFEEIKHAILIYQSGGKAIINLSKLRPKGTNVASTKGPASGPVAFLKVFDSAVSAMKQASKQGSLVAILPIDHPDILEFVSCKDEGKKLEHFQLQVGMTQSFMEALLQQKGYELINPQTKAVINKLDAQSVFDLLVNKNINLEEPGFVFVERAGVLHAMEPKNKNTQKNTSNKNRHEVMANGCINVAYCVKEGTFQWQKFGTIIHNAIHFLDNIFDISHYPSNTIAEKARFERKIGLGINGFAEMLQGLNINYSSAKALELAQEISSFLTKEAHTASQLLAEKRGPLNNETNLRNKTLITIIPDPIVNLIAEKTAGTEPSLSTKNIDPEASIRIQAIFQKDGNGIGESTISFPENATTEDLKKLILLCYQTGCQNIRLLKSKSSLLSPKNSDEQIELPFHRIVEETAQRKAKRQAQKNDVDRVQRSVTPQKAEEVLPPPIIINA